MNSTELSPVVAGQHCSAALLLLRALLSHRGGCWLSTSLQHTAGKFHILSTSCLLSLLSLLSRDIHMLLTSKMRRRLMGGGRGVVARWRAETDGYEGGSDVGLDIVL